MFQPQTTGFKEAALIDPPVYDTDLEDEQHLCSTVLYSSVAQSPYEF